MKFQIKRNFYFVMIMIKWITILRNTKKYEEFSMVDHVEIGKTSRMNTTHQCNKSTVLYCSICLTEIECFIYFQKSISKKFVSPYFFCTYDYFIAITILSYPASSQFLMNNEIKQKYVMNFMFLFLPTFCDLSIAILNLDQNTLLLKKQNISLIIIYKQLH